MSTMILLNNRTIDLHIHSNCSDGILSVSEIINKAVKLGLTTIAIADHDSLAGVEAGLAAAHLAGIENIPAIELSVQYQQYRDIHLLAYGLNYSDKAFCTSLEVLREQREQRNEGILARVNEQLAREGHDAIKLSHVTSYAKGVMGRPHIARALLEQRYATSIEDAFQRYLIPCNISKRYWQIDFAINVIKQLKGIAILAHPTTICPDRHILWQIISELTKIGLDGIEVYNNLANAEDMAFLRRKATEAGLLITGGSDYHGIEAGLEMGRGRGGIRFSASLLPPIKERLALRQKSQ